MSDPVKPFRLDPSDPRRTRPASLREVATRYGPRETIVALTALEGAELAVFAGAYVAVGYRSSS